MAVFLTRIHAGLCHDRTIKARRNGSICLGMGQYELEQWLCLPIYRHAKGNVANKELNDGRIKLILFSLFNSKVVTAPKPAAAH